ncbi:Plasmodium exported protein, unknown function, partial [Plasmodium vivax]
DIDFNRLLAHHEYKKQLDHSNLSKNLPSYSKFRDIKNEKNISKYSHVKKGKASDLDAYKKEYKKRYDKKKGIAKLDCYCEKKIFDKIEHAHDLAKKFVDDKKSYKKVIYRKYGYLLITFAVLPLLGLVIPVFFGEHNPLTQVLCLSNCRSKHGTSKTTPDSVEEALKIHKSAGLFMASIDENTWNIITTVNSVISYLLIFLFLFVVIYILIKVIKYEKLKSCKSKMSVKEYYRFCKNLF